MWVKNWNYGFFISNHFQSQHFVIHFVFENEKQIRNVFSLPPSWRSKVFPSVFLFLFSQNDVWGKRFWMRSFLSDILPYNRLDWIKSTPTRSMSQHGRQNVIHYTLLKLKGDFKRVERNFMKLKERESERASVCKCV